MNQSSAIISSMPSPWLLWQLADSAFPGGGFAHSNGLEAAWQAGCVTGDSLSDFLSAALTSTARAALPYVAAAHAGGAGDRLEWFAPLDLSCDVFLNNPVANRASRAQGRAFLSAAGRIFPVPPLARLCETVRGGRFPGHLAPAFGAATAALGLDGRASAELFLFLALRTFVSAAVRLGVVGPLEGQSVQHALSPFAAGLADRCRLVPIDRAAQTAPILDILQATHDRLYSRLFQS